MPYVTQADLSTFNTFGIRASTQKYIAVKSVYYLKTLVRELKNEQVFVLGGGSNILFVEDPEGYVLHMQLKGIEVIRQSNEFAWVAAGAGVLWHELVQFALKHNLGGIENLALIPGFCGAAPMQNIGAYGVELDHVFDHLEAINMQTGSRELFNKESCDFGYRSSVFKTRLKQKYIITKIVLKLSLAPDVNIQYGSIADVLEKRKINRPTIQDVANAVISIRQSKLPDPAETGNAGSFFKNPVINPVLYHQIKQEFLEIPGWQTSDGGIKVPAGWLIEKCGWKGKFVGDAGTWHQQALVIVNRGNALGKDILNLARTIRDDVNKAFAVELQPEVNLIGMNQEDF